MSANLTDWIRENVPGDAMYYASGYHSQVKFFAELEGRLGVTAEVVTTHTSKSIDLPVVRFARSGFGWVYLRDNFYDVKVVVDWNRPLDLPYEAVGHAKWSPAEHEKERQRARAYWVTGTDIDPKAYESDAWLERWSHATIIREPDGQWWKASGYIAKCYCEGINRLDLDGECFRPYARPYSQFCCSLSAAGARTLLDALWAVQS